MDSFWGNIFKREAQQHNTRTLLKNTPIFESMNRRELAAVERIMYRREYRAGEVIFQQGEPGLGMYIVQRGTVSIVYEPTGQLLTELGEGDFFGEIALLNETLRSATARAKTACTLWGLFQPELLDLLKRNPRLGVKLLLPLARIAGQRLVRADQQMQSLREEVQRNKTGVENELEQRDGAADSSVG
ncbi:MAG: cyclic nucleotide-binding domain-containing protein [Rhodothermales bacterium]